MSAIDLTGRVAIVTGAGAGLGRSHALLLAARGAKVVINDLAGVPEGHAERAAEVVAQEIRDLGGDAAANFDSVTTAEGCQSIVQTALDAFGGLHVVVNNAGIIRDKTLKNAKVENHIDPVIATHLLGTLYMCHAAMPILVSQDYGRIVNTTSAAGLWGNGGQVSYAAAKAGIEGATMAMALEGAHKGGNVRANCIAPVALTKMTEGVLGALAEVYDFDPVWVSPMVALLADESCPVNGQTFTCASGHYGRAITGETLGWSPDSFDAHVTPEDIAGAMVRISDQRAMTFPANMMDSVGRVADYGIKLAAEPDPELVSA